MSTAQRCLICKEGNWLSLIKDLVTGFVFCKTCNNEVEKEFQSLIGGMAHANWLRAIASILERR